MASRRYESMFTAAALFAAVVVVGGGLALVALTRSPKKPAPASADAAEMATEEVSADAPAKKRYDAPPPMTIDASKAYTAVLKTSLGEITAELYAKDAPLTVNNFVFLAGEGFYDGTIFHRIIDDFMMQGGDPLGTGTGGPGYQFANETKSTLKHAAFTLSMANSGPNTNGSQFFITEKAQPSLDGSYNVFGRVTAGQDVVLKATSTKTDASDRPVTPVVLESVTIMVDGKPMAGKAATSQPA